VDDVRVKGQKQFRPMPDGQKQKVQVSTTVVNVQKQEGKLKVSQFAEL
jgi:hypothetical protein